MAEVPMISNDSPVWKAVLWQKIGSKVKVKAPSGDFEYKILEIQ
jgi:transcription elongation GreA/GreB family factor